MTLPVPGRPPTFESLSLQGQVDYLFKVIDVIARNTQSLAGRSITSRNITTRSVYTTALAPGGTYEFASGSEADPSVACNTDVDTGLYWDPNVSLNVTVNGTKEAAFASNVVTIPNTIRVGTATDTATAGDLAAGLVGASRLFFDQSLQTLSVYDSAGNEDISLDAAGNSWYNGTGNFGIGTTSPAAAVHIVDAVDPQIRLGYTLTDYAQFDFSGELTLTLAAGLGFTTFAFEGGDAGEYYLIQVRNTDNTNGASGASVQMQVAGTSAGDPYLAFDILGGTTWILGADNSDSDKCKLSTAALSGLAGTKGVFFTSGIYTTFAPAVASSGTSYAVDISGAINTGGSNGLFRVLSAASTGQTASTEINFVYFDLGATTTWAAGALANQRAIYIEAPTLAFAGASTVTNAATLYIDRAPQAGTNATITNAYALWVDDGACRFDGGITFSSLTAGSVLFVGTGGVISQDNTNLFFNDSTNVLTVGGALVVGSTTTGISASPGSQSIDFTLTSTVVARIAVATTANEHITGSTAGDLCVRVDTDDILFSTDNGSNAYVKINTSGQVQFQDVTLDRVAGTNGGRLRLSPTGSTESAQMELTPGASVNPVGTITAEFVIYNVTGANYERVSFGWFSNEFILDVDATGSGTYRPFSIYTSAVPRVTWSATGGVVFNDGGLDYNFRVEGENVADLFSIDASADSIGIGTSSPSCLLHLVHSTSPELRLEGAATGSPILSFYQGASQRAFVQYQNASATLVADSDGDVILAPNNTSTVWVTSTGRLGVGATPSTIFHITSSGSPEAIIQGGATGDIKLSFYQGGSERSYFSYTNATSILRIDGDGDIVLAANNTIQLSIYSTGSVFNDAGGDFDFRVESDDEAYCLMVEGTLNNVVMCASAEPGFQSMDGGVFLSEANVVPTGNPTAGIYIYVESGAGKARGTGGTITTWAPAEPHCPKCGYDYIHEWENPGYEQNYLAVCMKCLTDEIGDRPWILRKKAA